MKKKKKNFFFRAQGRTGLLEEDLLATWVLVQELGHIVDLATNAEPDVRLGVVLLDLLGGEPVGTRKGRG